MTAEQDTDRRQTSGDAGPYVPALGREWLTWLFDPMLKLTTRECVFKERLLEQADLRAGMDVLDLGCGTGTLMVLAKRRVPEANVTGIDGDPNVLERARRKADRAGCLVKFDQGLSYDLPYAAASFDRVLSSLFFHHLVRRDKERTISELRRVLRPGGELHVADWGAPRGPVMKMLSTSIRLLDGHETTRDNLEGRLPWLFEEAGFEQVSTRGHMQTIYGTLAFLAAVSP
jgi:cyclopropane fatty-acyl-phospholipid synthase-like methyltransferase